LVFGDKPLSSIKPQTSTPFIKVPRRKEVPAGKDLAQQFLDDRVAIPFHTSLQKVRG
jgi:hypothetical protein